MLRQAGGLGVNIAVGFFLSPFILHHLGDEAFGLWVLIFSLTGYYGIFDFGIRSSLVRYVSKFQATGDKDELTRLINTSLFTYTCVGLALVVPTIIGKPLCRPAVPRSHRVSQRRPNSGFDSRVLPGTRVSLRHLGRHPRGAAKILPVELDQHCSYVGACRSDLSMSSGTAWTSQRCADHCVLALDRIGGSSRYRSAIAGHSLWMEICKPGFASAGGELRLGHFYDHRGRAIEVQD